MNLNSLEDSAKNLVNTEAKKIGFWMPTKSDVQSFSIFFLL